MPDAPDKVTEEKTYEGSCHCGAVRYEVTMAPPEKAITGNCSICKRAGWLLSFVPISKFRLLTDPSALKDYQFNKNNAHHLFCSTCGVRAFSRGMGRSGETAVINLRCLAGLDPTSLPIQSFDCASL